jgi:hypothetical protein
MDKGDEKALADIERYGCHVIHVAGDDDLPPFSYSVGIQKSTGKPEVVAIGLKQPLAHFVVNAYNDRARNGEAFMPGRPYSEFVEGFDVLVEKVDHAFYAEYFGWNLWLYAGPNFEVLQLVYPTTDGIWPWQACASEWFRNWQPILSATPTGPSIYR